MRGLQLPTRLVARPDLVSALHMPDYQSPGYQWWESHLETLHATQESLGGSTSQASSLANVQTAVTALPF